MLSARLNAMAFFMVVSLLFWVPIPLAGNRAWAWSLIEGWILLALIIWLVSSFNQPRLGLDRLRPYWLLLGGLGLVQLLVSFQLVALPIGMLQFLSPQLIQLSDNLGFVPETLSLDPGQSAILLFKGLIYVIFCALLLVLCDSRRRLRIIVYTILASGLFQAVYASIELLSGIDQSVIFQIPSTSSARGSFINRNHLANYLVLTSAIAIGYLVSQLSTSAGSRNYKSRVLGWLEGLTGAKVIVRISIILMVIAIVLTRSRMGNSAFFISMTAICVLALLFYKHKPRALWILVVSLFVIDLIVVGSWFGLERVKERLEATTVETVVRDDVVIMGLPMVADFPLVGTGAGSFYSSFPAYHTEGWGGFFDHAHNDYLQFAIEYGLPASLCLGFVLFYALILNYQTYSRRHSSLYKGVSLGCTMAIMAMLIHSTVEFSLQMPANALLFIAILALCWLCRYLPAERHKERAWEG